MEAMDLEQQRQADTLARNIANVINRPVIISAFFCEDCDTAIPEARRRAVHGVTRCVICQEIAEQKAKLGWGNAQ
ncbi:TraR/DksA C4-type zinc finger protein [Duffyella gerundensis]|uniref:TraR/DksA C4-type zinc finger protein n=1 Tax=Duffyella gerundensis TaxID=1619313 RepID=UPI001654455D|nr:TraR/DksA C4-type zinc finger protein [Duffyella gerundensis]